MWLGNGDCYKNLIALFTVDLIEGKNITQRELRSQSIREYLCAINELFTDRGYDPPVDFDDKHNSAVIFYNNLKTWENEPNRRTHITQEFLLELFRRANDEPNAGLGFSSSLKDWVILGRYTGVRLAEYGQSTQQIIDQHVLPTGAKITKAFLRRDFRFFDKSGCIILDPTTTQSRDRIHKVSITWRVQKNRRNGQTITWHRDIKHARLCPVMAALRIYDRSIRLGLSDYQPMGAYFERNRVRYITGSKITALFKDIARTIYPDITPRELSVYSSHMIRVTAAVLLQISDKSPDFVKSRLRWEGDSYKTYLRNTSAIAQKHISATLEPNSAFEAYYLDPQNLPDSTANNSTVPRIPPGAFGSYISIS